MVKRTLVVLAALAFDIACLSLVRPLALATVLALLATGCAVLSWRYGQRPT